jgi:3-oxoisoapionate decarboxylase
MTDAAFATRREFLALAAASAAAVPLIASGAESPAAPSGKRLKLGFDNFSIRALKLKAPALLDFAAEQKVDTLLISDLDSYDSLEPAALAEVGKKARDLGVELHVGTLSICPTSTKFDRKRGTAEEHLRTLISTAHGTGSKVARCVLGFGEDRKTPGGIEARIADTVVELKKVRSQALDTGVTLAVENHAGDMQAWELVTLIEAAGKDFVGATIDSGNATWTLEDPVSNLAILAPYIISSGIRDSQIWEVPEGASVQWTAMGEGIIDWVTYFKNWASLAPERPVVLEIISGFAKAFKHHQPEFWNEFKKVRKDEFAAFLALAKKGKAIPPGDAGNPEYQKAELLRSLKFCRETLGLGRKR